MWGVGVFHPEPGKYALPPDYVLTAAEIRRMNIAGVPLTVEHHGIHAALAQLATTNTSLTPANIGMALERLGHEHVPVGIVHTTFEHDRKFYCVFQLDPTYPSLVPLIRSGALCGLSLSHINAGQKPAVEISLCSKPARPGQRRARRYLCSLRAHR